MASPIFIGVDPSTFHVAIVARSSGGKLLHCRKEHMRTAKEPFVPQTIANAADMLYTTLAEIAEQRDDPLSVYIEQPLVGRGGVRTTVNMSMVVGSLVTAARWGGATTHVVNVQTWKASVVRRQFANATKGEVADAIKALWPEAYEAAGGDQDLIDASSISFYGSTVTRRRKPG